MTLPVTPEFISSSKRIHHGSLIVLWLSAIKATAICQTFAVQCAQLISLIINEVSREKIGAAPSAIDKIDHGSKIASVHHGATNDISVTHLRWSKWHSDDEKTYEEKDNA
jgi:hypothetical protein